jgi:hypothetical protein
MQQNMTKLLSATWKLCATEFKYRETNVEEQHDFSMEKKPYDAIIIVQQITEKVKGNLVF